MKHIKKFENFDKINEDIFTVTGAIILGILGFKLLKSFIYKLIKKYGMNIKIRPETLKKSIINFQSIILKNSPESIDVIDDMMKYINTKIESGEIDTIGTLKDEVQVWLKDKDIPNVNFK